MLFARSNAQKHVNLTEPVLVSCSYFSASLNTNAATSSNAAQKNGAIWLGKHFRRRRHLYSCLSRSATFWNEMHNAYRSLSCYITSHPLVHTKRAVPKFQYPASYDFLFFKCCVSARLLFLQQGLRQLLQQQQLQQLHH